MMQHYRPSDMDSPSLKLILQETRDEAKLAETEKKTVSKLK